MGENSIETACAPRPVSVLRSPCLQYLISWCDPAGISHDTYYESTTHVTRNSVDGNGATGQREKGKKGTTGSPGLFVALCIAY